jgi:hypothetical protein
MITKHTPGPWRLGQQRFTDFVMIEGPKGQVTGWKQEMIGEVCWVSEEDKANARLIAAAPELLDLAKEALAQLEKMDFTLSANWNGSIKTNVALLLDAVIAKAEGRG